MKKGFTLIELMIVVLIVAILAAVAVPLMRGRIEAAKWSEGKAGLGTVATAIRAYHAEKGTAAGSVAPDAIIGMGATALGFAVGDLEGTYFSDTSYALTAVSLTPTLTFIITATPDAAKDGAPTTPASMTLDETGAWAEGAPAV